MWSVEHYLLILSPFVFAVILMISTKKNNYDENRKLGVILSLVAILILVLRNAEIWVKGAYSFNAELVPLQICHFANFVLLFAFWKNSKPLFAFATLLNLPAAFMSIEFANFLTHYATIMTFRGMAYVFGHMLIVGLTIFAFARGFVSLNKKVFIQTLTIVGILYVSSIFINNFFRLVLTVSSNYFYTALPENGTPLELFYGLSSNVSIGSFEFNPLYLILTAMLGFLVMSLLYIALIRPSQKQASLVNLSA